MLARLDSSNVQQSADIMCTICCSICTKQRPENLFSMWLESHEPAMERGKHFNELSIPIMSMRSDLLKKRMSAWNWNTNMQG
jgi:hypothetical protein